MTVPCLLVTTGAPAFGAARIPRALSKSGFEVALLAPRESLPGKSRFVDRVGHLPDAASGAQWVFAFAAMVKAVAPRIVLPGDDMALHLLEMLVTAPPGGMQPAMQASLAALVCASLGDPAHFATTSDPALVQTVATELGLAPAHGNAARAADAADGEAPRNIAVQLAAHEGKLLAGWASETVVAGLQAGAAASVVRRMHHPAAHAAAAELVAALGMTGLVTIEFSVDASDQVALVRIDRTVPAGAHVGAKIGVDLCAALLDALEGRPQSTPARLAPEDTGYNVRFPQEWLRDPYSEWLRKYPVDVPWDEPELFETFIAMRPTG